MDVLSVVESMPSAKDRDLVLLARKENRCIITFDRDYGDLIFREGLPPPPAILYFRQEPYFPAEPAEVVLALLSEPQEIERMHDRDQQTEHPTKTLSCLMTLHLQSDDNIDPLQMGISGRAGARRRLQRPGDGGIHFHRIRLLSAIARNDPGCNSMPFRGGQYAGRHQYHP